MQKPETDTIFAVSSGFGRAGVAVIRISGPLCQAMVEGLVSETPEPRYAALRMLRNPQTQTSIDQGLVLWFPAPKSFTGEDVAELHVHGGRAVIQAVLGALTSFPHSRMAEPGEFARRAFYNGKLDLTAVEGLADLIDAETEAQRCQALRQASGVSQRLYDSWREKLIEVLALTEAALDFSDEADVSSEAVRLARPQAESLLRDISGHLSDNRRGEIVRDGFRVVIAGPPNAGKSSLLNVLARRDAAIVSDEPGTTRDLIAVHLDLDGVPVIITDTAGLREAAGKVEQEGIRRALSRISDADLILWLGAVDIVNNKLPEDLVSYEDKTVKVLNKIDLLAGAQEKTAEVADILVSAETGEGIGLLSDLLLERAKISIGSLEDVVISNVRQRQELEACRDALAAYVDGDESDLELRAEDLRQAAYALGRITGRVDVEDVLDRVFAAFCIGK